jgi:type IV secretory pathway VirB9-like protein
MKFALKKFTLSLALLTLCQNALAVDDSPNSCKVYHWKPNDIIQVQAQLFKTTSIKLPEDSLDVIWGAKELWFTESVKNYVFIKPLTSKPDGQETVFTVVGQSGNSYEFSIERVPHLISHCVVVDPSGGLINKTAWNQADAAQVNLVSSLRSQVSQLQKEIDRKTEEALKLYRAAINSNYEWGKADGWYAATGTVVESVYDDGRFTYVKLHDDARGLMTILGDIEDKSEILESSYKAETHTYVISGIFPKFILRAGDSNLVITRKGV